MPFLLIGAVSAVITLISQGQTAEVHLPGQYPLLRIVLMLCHNTVFYLWRIVWPVRASAFHPFPQPLTLASPGILAGIVGTCILIMVLALSLRRTRALLAGWLFFFVAILPAMGVVGFTIVIAADRFVYLPVVGLLMVLASLLGRVWSPSGPASFVGLRRAGLVALVAVLATAEIRGTRHYLGYWRDSETLCRYFIEGAAHVPILHFNLAGVLASQRRYDEAAAAYREAIRLKSDYYEARGGLATVLEKQGRLGEAMEQYREAIKGPPTRIKARILFNMGVALGKQGRTDEAIECYRQSLSIHRDDFAVHTNLGAMLLNQRRIDEAIEHFTAAVRINPNAAMPHRNLGMALTAQGRLGDAALAYRRTLRIEPGDTAVRCELAAILTALGRFDESADEYRRVLAADPFHRLAQEGLQQAISRRNNSSAP
jgi:Tfp pilus assembly protein PilF